MRRASRGSAPHDDAGPAPGQGFYQPGQPIGFLKARGTPYEKKYLSRKLGYCCIFVAPITILITLAITLVPVLYAVANHALKTSALHIYASNITAPGNDSFPLTLEGQVRKTGIFPAHLYFREPVQVYWTLPPQDPSNLDEERVEVNLGQLSLDYIGVAAGHGRIKQASQFIIKDQQAFSQFAKFLITQEEFTWNLKCGNVHVEAFSFLPTYKNLVFSKNVVFKGFNNFEDVGILDFQLPGDDPQGGISLIATTTLRNPSPFGVQIGTLNVDLFYKGMYLGPASTTNLNVTAGVNVISLSGRLVPHLNNQTELDLLGELFTGYINGETLPTIARGVSATQMDGSRVEWLSQGIQALEIQVPLKAPQPIEPIKGINIGSLALIFSPETSYNPTAFSNALSARIGLPFGFSLNIVSAANSITLLFDGAQVATINGAYSNSSTRLDLISAGQTAGTLDLTLPPSELSLPNNTQAARTQLENFERYFTFSDGTGIRLQGASRALTDTPLGRVLLNGILFDVESGILGLQGLTAYDTVINKVDVVGGTQDGINLVVDTTLVNPSNLNLTIGDSVFQLKRENETLGSVTLPNLNLMIGRNDVNATSSFAPNNSPLGYDTLNRFISGQDTFLNIDGFSGSSQVQSLVPALSGIRLNSTLPGLRARLVNSANLTVLDTTGITDDRAESTVFLQNPFTSDLKITGIKSNVTSHGIFVASIDTPLDFTARGRSVTQSPPVSLNLNLFPPDIFSLVRALAIQSGQDPAYIDGVVQLGGYTLSPSTSANTRRSLSDDDKFLSKRTESEEAVGLADDDDELARTLLSVGNNVAALADMEERQMEDMHMRYVEADNSDVVLQPRAVPAEEVAQQLLEKRDNLYTGFDLPTYVGRAFSVATANLEIESAAQIGDYSTSLTFAQVDVPLGTDVTLNKLLPVLAKPIVQKIVDGAVLSISRATILDPQQNSFNTALQGTITNAGPFDAVISFPEGLTISWEGRPLGQIAFPNVSLAGDIGATLELEAQFAVADVGYLTEFTKYLLTQPNFVWNIAGKGLSVSALGISVPDITISKDVLLTGFNGLQRSVIINSFDLPSNDPAGGIRLTAVSTIYNPAQIGVQLSRFGVGITRNGTYIGPSAAQSEFVLQAAAVTELPLVGRLVQQTSDQGLAALSEIFTNFVNNRNTDIVINGDYAGPESVTWLNDGIKVLQTTVALPAQQFTVIRSISLNQLSLFFTEQTAWNPSTSSDNTTSSFFLPFAFPVDIQQVGGGFIANYQNQDIALLDIPPSPSITDVVARVLTLMFQNVPFAVYSDKHPVFSQFLADTTAGTEIRFNLNGKADTKANTAAGLVTISDIPFNVDTNILGLQNLNARPVVVSDLDVNRGFPDYLLIKITATLFNPSDITIGTGDVSFDLFFMDRPIGKALIYNLVLVPGENRVPTDVRYSPQGAANVAAGQMLLENYVQGIVSDTVIAGSRDTTPIASLKQALSGIRLNAQIPPLQQLLITEAALVIPKDIAQTSIASATFTLRNPFTASINLLQVLADASYQGIFLGRIDENLRNRVITAPGRTTITSYPLPFRFNLDPKNLIRFVSAAAAATGTDLGPLPPLFDQVLASPNTDTTVSPYPDDNPPPCSSGNQFDVLGAVLRLLQGLTTTLNIQSVTKLDEYQTNLNFVQQPVPTRTDNTALYLLGPAGAPIVQNLVNQATLTVAIANVTSVTNNGFTVSLQGALLGTGPFDAYIEFPEPLTVTWQGSDIAQLSLPPICAFANEGVPDLRTVGQLRITNLRRFTDFATFILANPDFQWTVSSKRLRVRALGIAFSNVIISKNIDFKAFNGLPGVTISNFDIPGETSNSLLIQTQALIPSPATLGIQLDTANFEIFFMGTDIGPVSANNLFLAALATTETTLNGQITRKSGRDLANTGILFTNFLQGKNQTLQVTGVSVVTEANGNQPVNWLSAAFKTLTLNVILPGRIYQIIFSITLSDLTVKVNGDPADSYTVPSGSNSTIAIFANPFRFSLQPIRTGTDITIVFNNADTATLALPSAPVQAGTSRGPQDFQPLQLTWQDQNIVSINNPVFQAFFAQLTDEARGTFDLKGGASVVARTVIGDVPIDGIPFNVTTSLTGINSFNRVATISDVNVRGGSPNFVFITLQVSLFNPSNLTVFTLDVINPALFQNQLIGRNEIPVLGLIPGVNNVAANFYYAPPDPNNAVAQSFLQTFIQPSLDDGVSAQVVPLTIDGRALPQTNLTPYDSLRPALAGLFIETQVQGIGSRIVQKINVYLGLETILTGLASLLGPITGAVPEVEIDLLLRNDLNTSIFVVSLDTVAKATGSAKNTDNPDATAMYTFPQPFAVPPQGQAQTGRIPNVKLVKGLIASLPVIGKNLDVYNTIAVNIGPSVGDSYRVPSLKYNELNIPTTYLIDLGVATIPLAGALPSNPLDLLGMILNLPGGPQGVAGLLTNLTNADLLNPNQTPVAKDLICGASNSLSGGGLLGDLLNPIRVIGNCPEATSSSSVASSTASSSGTSSASSSTGGAGVAGLLPTGVLSDLLPNGATTTTATESASETAATTSSSGGEGLLPNNIPVIGGLRRRVEPTPRFQARDL